MDGGVAGGWREGKASGVKELFDDLGDVFHLDMKVVQKSGVVAGEGPVAASAGDDDSFDAGCFEGLGHFGEDGLGFVPLACVVGVNAAAVLIFHHFDVHPCGEKNLKGGGRRCLVHIRGEATHVEKGVTGFVVKLYTGFQVFGDPVQALFGGFAHGVSVLKNRRCHFVVLFQGPETPIHHNHLGIGDGG